MTTLRPSTTVAADDVLEILRRYRFRFTDEVSLHRSLAQAFRQSGLSFEREVRLSQYDRIDFMLGRVGVEVKVQGGWRAVRAQLLRYAESERVDELVLVTVKTVHRLVPREMNEKPVFVHQLTSSAL